MIALSFRVKLLLAMMAVVVGVTGATLYVTQQRVQATYQRLFQEQFAMQVDYFSELQEARLSAVKEKCEALAKSVRLRAALEAEDAQRAYDDAWTELDLPGLRNLRLSLRRKSDLAIPGPGALNDLFLRIIDAKGQVLPPPDGRPGTPPLKARRRLERQLEFVGQAMQRLELQQVGYLAPEIDTGKFQLAEVIVTRIVEPTTQETLGAIVLGFPLPGLGERALNDMSQIQSGIWLANEIHSRTIPETIRPQLAELIAKEVKVSEPPRERVLFHVSGVPHRVFYKLLNPRSPFPPAYQVCLYSLASALATQRELRGRILAFSTIALLGALAINLLLSHRLTLSIRDLVAGTREIGRGNFQAKVPVRSRDEFGHLATSFNEMAEGLALKEKYHNVLNMVADKDVAEQLMSGQVALGGETREVSVLFCDIRGFTALTQNMPPDKVIRFLNEHMTALTQVVYEHKGVVDKFVGDLIMAVFGAPKSYGHDVENAVHCARRMIEAREKLNQTAAHPIQVGIGVATGLVVAGCMGSTDRIDYTVLGPRVNLASRLCSKAPPGTVVIDDATYARLRDTLQVEPLPPLTLKGFDGTVQAYALQAIQPAVAVT